MYLVNCVYLFIDFCKFVEFVVEVDPYSFIICLMYVLNYMNQVSAAGTGVAVVYMRIFLPESVAGVGIAGTGNKTEDESLLRKDLSQNKPSFRDTISLLRTRCAFSFFTCQLCFV